MQSLPPLPPEIKALIFDVDGTLLDTMDLHYRACQAVCQPKGFDFPHDFFLAWAGVPAHKTFEALMKELSLPFNGFDLAEEKERVFATLIPEIKPLAPVLAFAKEHYGKLPMALGTGLQRPMLEVMMLHSQIGHMFDCWVSADDVVNPKPDPETFLKGAIGLNVAPENCLVLEDGVLGIEAAKSGGMQVWDVRPFLI
jgi:beta-phosphoglucomutase-like phosphatase (HAD superfamily)